MLKQTTVNKTKQRTEKEKSNKAANKTVLASKKKNTCDYSICTHMTVLTRRREIFKRIAEKWALYNFYCRIFIIPYSFARTHAHKHT